MVNSLLAPSAIIGLMGQRRNQNSLLPFFQQQADPLDELMAARAGQGYQEVAPPTPEYQFGQYAPVGSQQAQQAAPAGPAQRERVSPLNVLFRGLAPNLSGALDTERARLQAEADRPQMLAIQQENERIARALGPQALLSMRLNPQAAGESFGYGYRPQVVANGALQSTAATGQVLENPNEIEFGDSIASVGRGGAQILATRQPSYQEATARINATNPVSVAQDATLVDPYSGRTIAQGVQRPDIQNVAPGGEALAFDAAGNIVNRVASIQQRPQSAAEIKRADDLELALAQDQNSVDRVNAALALITDPDGPEGALRAPVRVGPWENAGASLLNRAGRSNENSLGIAQIKTTVESLRQGILNDATGPQTEGDALRALNSILNGLDDSKVIAQGFQDYLAAKKRTMRVRESQIGRIRGGGGSQAGASTVPPPPPGFELDR